MVERARRVLFNHEAVRRDLLRYMKRGLTTVYLFTDFFTIAVSFRFAK